MRVGSLFAGVGGFDAAAERAGMAVAWQSEVDRHASEVLAQHWPNVPNYGDIHGIKLARYTKANRPRYLTDLDRTDAVRFYEAGESLDQVAARFAVTRQSMHDLLKRRTEMRPGRRYGKDNHFYRGGSRDGKRAQGKVERAIAKGDLIRPEACEQCGTVPPPMKDGRTRIQAHHDDYDNPLEVRWICQECHHDEHKGGGGPNGILAPATDVLVGGFP